MLVANLGSPPWWFRNSFSTLRDPGGSKRDVQPFSLVPFGGAVYAPECKKDSYVYETFILNVTKILREERFEQEPKTSKLLATSVCSWVFVTKTTSMSSMCCRVPCVGKGVKKIMAVSVHRIHTRSVHHEHYSLLTSTDSHVCLWLKGSRP